MADLVDQFIKALKEELVAAAKKKKAAGTTLLNGRLQSRIGHTSIYEFVTSELCLHPEEQQGKLTVAGEEFDCTIVATNGLHVSVAIHAAKERLCKAGAFDAAPEAPIIVDSPDSNDSETIDKAIFVPTTGAILERLIDRFEHTPLDARSKIFSFAEEVFQGKNQRLGTLGGEAIYSYETHNAPNESQACAIENSFRNSLAIIWGPPGTGKTRTIARAVEAHLNAGRTVLLLSHANTAVDTALEGVASQLENDYLEGRIVRWGNSKDTNLQQKFPLLFPANQIAEANEQLQYEREIEEKEIESLQIEIEQLVSFKATRENALRLERKLYGPEIAASQAAIDSTKEARQHASKTAPAQASKKTPAQTPEMVSDQSTYEKLLEEIDELKKRLQEEQAKPKLTKSQQETDLRIRIKSLENFLPDCRKSYEASIEVTQKELAVAEFDLDQHIYQTGLSPNDIEKHLAYKQERLEQLKTKIEDTIPKTEIYGVLNDAKVVGATLSKLFTDSSLQDKRFDVAIVDEASMVPLPHLYWALSKIKMAVTLVGDFKQLPPIVQSASKHAQEWLGRSIFDVLNIASVEQSKQSNLVTMLDTQFRMAPEIAAVSSEMFYGGLLQSSKSTSNLGLNDSIFGNSRIVIIDTSVVDPWSTAAKQGGKFNIYSTGVAVKLCERLLAEHPDINIGLTTTYKLQSQQIAKGLEDKQLDDRVMVNTVHKFQGSEASVVIFDCTDGPGTGGSMLHEYQRDGNKSNAEVLLNVALTRARSLFVLIVNKEYYLKNHKDGLLCKFVEQLSKDGLTLSSTMIDGNYKVEADDQPGYFDAATTPCESNHKHEKTVYNEKNFWSALWQDLADAKESVCIMSPFLTMHRSQEFFEAFAEMVRRGVAINLYTKPIEEQSDNMEVESENVIRNLRDRGVAVTTISKMHQKVVIIDNEICWEGSLNILSHRNSLEHMRRITGRQLCTEVRHNLRLTQTGRDALTVTFSCEPGDDIPAPPEQSVIKNTITET